MSGHRHRHRALLGIGVLAVVACVTVSEPAAAEPVPSTPVVAGPITGGSRTGGPWLATPFDLGAFGYVEQEYFLSGTASNRGHSSFGIANVEPSPVAESTAPFAIRILVRRPVEAARFNGTAVVEWANVSNQADFEATWGESHTYLMERGYISVAVSAQKAGVDQPPLGMTWWDPVRYAALQHPGDDFSYDIFTQAARSLRNPAPGSIDPLGGLRPDRIIGTGASQSCFRLINYINLFAADDAAYDGFNPSVCMTTNRPIRTDVAPIMWLNTETELATQGDGGLLRLWEVAGASHLGWYPLRFGLTAAVRDLTAGLDLDLAAISQLLTPLLPAPLGTTAAALGPWDETTAGTYGEHGEVGPCPQNFYPTRFAYNAALDHLNRWLIDGTVPPAAARFPRTLIPTRADLDDAGNAVGGLRLPTIDVPIASYVAGASPCVLLGATVPMDPISLRQRYPTHQDYACAIDAAATAATAAGYLLTDDADELRMRATASTLWGDQPADVASCTAATGVTPPAIDSPAHTDTVTVTASGQVASSGTLPVTGAATPTTFALLMALAAVACRRTLRATGQP